MKSPHEVEATLVAEMDIHERDVRPELLGALKRLGRTRRHTYDRDPFTLEQNTRRVQEAGVVVDDQTAKHNPRITRRTSGRIPASRRSARVQT
jgi:hypothetical protein